MARNVFIRIWPVGTRPTHTRELHGNTRVFGVVVLYFLQKYTVYFPCNLRVPTETTRNTRETDTPQWRNDGEITLIY